MTYLAQYLGLFLVRLLETEVLQHHRIRFTFLSDQRLHFCHLLPSSFTHFFQTRTGNMHWHGWKRKLSGGGGAECTGGDERVRCIYHTRPGMRQNDRFITTILFSWSREAKIEIEFEIQSIGQPYCIGAFQKALGAPARPFYLSFCVILSFFYENLSVTQGSSQIRLSRLTRNPLCFLKLGHTTEAEKTVNRKAFEMLSSNQNMLLSSEIWLCS